MILLLSPRFHFTKMIRALVLCLGEVDCATQRGERCWNVQRYVEIYLSNSFVPNSDRKNDLAHRIFSCYWRTLPVVGIPLLSKVIRVCGWSTNFMSPILLPKVNLSATTASLFQNECEDSFDHILSEWEAHQLEGLDYSDDFFLFRYLSVFWLRRLLDSQA